MIISRYKISKQISSKKTIQRVFENNPLYNLLKIFVYDIIFQKMKSSDIEQPTVEGKVFKFNKDGSVAYRTNIESNKFLIFVDGMYGMMLSIPYFHQLKNFCDSNGVVLVYPQLRSHPHFRIHKVEDDIEDIVDIIKMLDGEIIIMGHSTGCQNSLLYLAHGKDPKVKGVILQAPVSDIEGNNDPQLKDRVAEAKQSGKFYIYENEAWLSQRFITVYEQRNKQDLFSSYLENSLFERWKQATSILSILSLKDQYCKHDLRDKFNLMGQVLCLENANHSIKCLKQQEKLIEGISKFLKKINFI